MANSHSSPDNQDFDLGQLSQRVRNYFSRLGDSIFDGILFIKRNIIILIILVLLGGGLGYYMDTKSTVFEQKVFVIPNFGSVDYLYEEVENITYKIRKEDPQFIKLSGIEDPEKFVDIEIEPIVEIYDFIEPVDAKELNTKFEVFRLISENSDMKKVLEDKPTARNYKNHLITIRTAGRVSRSEIVDPLLKYFNSNAYFLKMKGEYTENLKRKIAANDTIIKQIDALLNDASTNKNSNAVYYKDNTELNEVIRYKNKLTKEQGQNRIDLANYSNIVEEAGLIDNVKAKLIFGGRMKIFIPFIFILVFVGVVRFKNYYNRQVEKRKIAAKV
ncbi:MAG: hypothetical protein DI539_01905 [Flavobacterium psychrophilum]|nr:MAG: hypothetical protein DI539_01905 [Flavobacterium psychrophilum]